MQFAPDSNSKPTVNPPSSDFVCSSHTAPADSAPEGRCERGSHLPPQSGFFIWGASKCQWHLRVCRHDTPLFKVMSPQLAIFQCLAAKINCKENSDFSGYI